jgi:dienelactone hydrolase
MRRLLKAALNTAQFNGADSRNAVALGYCFGGAAVLELARSGESLKGFVSIHGGLATPEGQDYSSTQGEVLILHGAADQNIKMDVFAALANELEVSGVAHEMIAYGRAEHAFSVFGDQRYQKTADDKSWVRLTGFLRQVLKTPE